MSSVIAATRDASAPVRLFDGAVLSQRLALIARELFLPRLRRPVGLMASNGFARTSFCSTSQRRRSWPRPACCGACRPLLRGKLRVVVGTLGRGQRGQRFVMVQKESAQSIERRRHGCRAQVLGLQVFAIALDRLSDGGGRLCAQLAQHVFRVGQRLPFRRRSRQGGAGLTFAE